MSTDEASGVFSPDELVLMWFAMLKPPDVLQLHVPMLPHLRTQGLRLREVRLPIG